MDPRQYIVLHVFLIILPGHISLASGTTISVCQKIQEGQINCSQKFSMIIPQGMMESLNILVDITKQKIVSRCGLQKNEETELLLGREELHSFKNKIGASLVNQTFTLMNVKKADEGLYVIKELNGGKCWAQINVTVTDLPTSPDITNLPNISTSITPTWFPLGKNNTASYTVFVIVAVPIILLSVGIGCCYKKYIKKKAHRYRCNASSKSSPEVV